MSILERTIGILSPPECLSCGREGLALCDNCSASVITAFGERCWRCNALSPNSRTCSFCRHSGSPAHVWVATDHAGPARDLLSLYKFGHQRSAAGPIARIMSSAFLKSGGGAEDYLIVPIPTATSRVRERGFGHAELLAKKIAAELRQQHAIVLRRLSQVRQLGSAREDRLRQLSTSFTVKNQKLLANRKILLIDDVVTTGGTLVAAAQVLRAAGAKQVDALLFAKHL
jgi:ComF family protein